MMAFPPDGMPLIWCLRLAGARLRDRVYGPTFMRQFLTTAPAESTHYLLGGSAACGAQLRAVFGKLNPGLRFVGAFHGKCQADGRMEGAADEAVIEEINRLSPDFIWVGFGTPKQQAWVKRYKSRLRRGVILTVGFAFDVNAGMKPDAPPWMQRLGLTWVYRLRLRTAPARLALPALQHPIPLLPAVGRPARSRLGQGGGARGSGIRSCVDPTTEVTLPEGARPRTSCKAQAGIFSDFR